MFCCAASSTAEQELQLQFQPEQTSEVEQAEEAEERRFVLLRAQKYPIALESLPKRLKADREVVLAAVKTYPHNLEHAHPDLRGDREVVLAAMTGEPAAMQHASEKLLSDKDSILELIQKTRALFLLDFATDELKKDEKFRARCKEAAGTGLVFTWYQKHCPWSNLRNMLPIAGASVPGGPAYKDVMKLINESIHGSAATVWFGDTLVFGNAADDGRWTHPAGDCGRDQQPVPARPRDRMWETKVESRSKEEEPEVDEKYICWCCHWLRKVKAFHEEGKIICCSVSNIFFEDWVREYGAGSSELKTETFKNGTPDGWGTGKIQVGVLQFDRAAQIHSKTDRPLGVGCRWERHVLDQMDFPVYATFMP